MVVWLRVGNSAYKNGRGICATRRRPRCLSIQRSYQRIENGLPGLAPTLMPAEVFYVPQVAAEGASLKTTS